MSIIQDKDFKKIKKILTEAYCEKEKTTVDMLWTNKVMTHIRDLSPYDQTGVHDNIYKITWRLIPVACALIILLSMAIVQVDMISDYELTEIFLEDPIDYTFLSLTNS